MPDLATVGTQIIIGAVPLGASWFAYRASTDANKRTAATAQLAADMERTKVDSEAFERARTIYDSGISLLERQLARVQEQFDRLNEDASEERVTLVSRIRTMQSQIEGLESTVALLRRQLIEAGIPPAARPMREEPGAPA